MKFSLPFWPLVILVVILASFALGQIFSSKSRTSNITQAPNISAREIDITAKQFEFVPNKITVNLGESLRLKLTSLDVTHGFSIPEYGINETIEPGKTAIVEFQATKKGTFAFLCSVQCGTGHAGMRGTLVVE